MEYHSISGFKIIASYKLEQELNPNLKISFKNFKRFSSFPLVELKPLTFFVGPNNAGKSTSVKLIDLVLHNLKSYLNTDFQFKVDGTGNWREFHTRNTNENTINISVSIGDFDISLLLEEQQNKVGENNSPAIIEWFNLKNKVSGAEIEMLFKYEICIIKLVDKINDIENSVQINDLPAQLEKLNEQINLFDKKVKNSDYLRLIDKRNKLVKDIESNEKSSKKKEGENKVIEFNISKKDFDKNSIALSNILNKIQNYINFQIYENIQEISDLEKIESELDDNKIEDLKVRNQQLQQILDDKRLKNFFSDFQLRMDAQEVVYLNANLSKQQPLFLIKDTENQLSQAIHAFAQLKEFSSNSTDYSLNTSEAFLLRWFRAFNIGYHVEIKPVNGIAYTFHFSQESNKETFDSPLSEMGMGTIQLTTLLLRLATLIRKSEKENKLYLVLVEEPELSLHPNFQSLLCDLFYEVHNQFPRIRFVIETHSEYIIRKTQRIGIDNKLFNNQINNPFSVIYFDKEEGPYEMKYREDGVFINDFGSGFYDVSSKDAMYLILKSKKNNG